MSAAVLLRFAGFALAGPAAGTAAITTTEAEMLQLERLADEGLCPSPLAHAHGWLALPWVAGRRLGCSDVSADMIARIARQIAAAAGPPLDEAEKQHAVRRLTDMLVTNTRELLGEHAAARAARASEGLSIEASARDLPSYGGGRLAPCAWITTDGAILKVDAGGHAQDHTVIGHQSVVWDIAGAVVEWNLADDGRDTLARVADLAGGSTLLGWYCAAYAAFRAGAAVMLGAPEEAARFYRLRLWRELARIAPN